MKKIILLFITFISFINNVNAINLNINSRYAYIYNLDENKIIYEKNAYDEIKVASLTKIMTAILVIEKNKDLNEKVEIKDEDLRDMYEYTTAGFKAGDVVTIKDLLYGILLASGSDAVNAAARITAGSEANFVDLMNQKVKELNLTHTYFSNPIGKDDGNYSSVHDISEILKYCLKNSDFKEIISTKEYLVKSLDIKINGPLVKSFPKYNIDTSMITGAKSGYTTESMHSLCSFMEKDDLTYIVVTSYAESYKNLLIDTNNIYNYLINTYKYYDYNINFNIKIEHGVNKSYMVNLTPKLFLTKDYNKKLITYKYTGKKKINFLINKGDKLGKINIYYDKELIKTIDVRLNDNIKYKPRAYLKISTILILFIIMFVLIITFKKIKLTYRRMRNMYPKKNVIAGNKNEIDNSVNVRQKQITLLNTTIDIEQFYDILSIIDDEEKKKIIEHNFIDRCFNNIDFTSKIELERLYLSLNKYKSKTDEQTIKYYNKLFEYCYKKYINK